MDLIVECLSRRCRFCSFVFCFIKLASSGDSFIPVASFIDVLVWLVGPQLTLREEMGTIHSFHTVYSIIHFFLTYGSAPVRGVYFDQLNPYTASTPRATRPIKIKNKLDRDKTSFLTSFDNPPSSCKIFCWKKQKNS